MRPQKITFGEMRSGGGPTGILVYCADYRCSHSVEMSAEQWPDDVELVDLLGLGLGRAVVLLNALFQVGRRMSVSQGVQCDAGVFCRFRIAGLFDFFEGPGQILQRSLGVGIGRLCHR
jgi:hypothetical protein